MPATAIAFLLLTLLSLPALGEAPANPPAKEPTMRTVQRVVETLERRFLSPENVLYDFVGPTGDVLLPTPEECRLNQPNAFAWNTPIENGGFFNGDLLAALVRLHQRHPIPQFAPFAARLADGLKRLQDVSPTPACILRGFGSDGRCHYPASSADQVTPFLLGLWLYANSDLASPEERRDCRERCLRTVRALRQNRWIIPGTQPGFERGNLLAKHPHSVNHLLLAAMILDDCERPDAPQTPQLITERLDAIAAGYPDMTPHACWYSSHNFFILRLVLERYPDAPFSPALQEALRKTAQAAQAALPYWRKYDDALPFSPNWRELNAIWFEQRNAADGDRCANPQFGLWRRVSPAVMHERETIMPSLTAAWFILFSQDKPLIDANLPEIRAMLAAIPYETLHYAPFFFAVNVIAEIEK